MSRKIHEFERNSLITFSIMMVANICNYLYQIIMGNLLTTVNFGNLNTLFSLSLVVSVPAGILQLIAIKYTAYYKARNEDGKASCLLHRLMRISMFAAAITFLIGFFLTGLISQVLHIDQKGYIIFIMALVSLSYITSVTNGTLQGLKRFVPFSMTSIISTTCKLIGGVTFVVLGFGLYGNIAALFMGSLGVIFFGMYMLRDLLKEKDTENSMLNKNDIKHYFQTAFWVQLMTAVLTNGDILLVKTFAANPTDAGIYSSGMVIGKISMYLATAMIAVLFPMVAEQQAKKIDTRPLFGRAILFGGGLAVAFAIVINLFGGTIIGKLFGERYAQAVSLLFPISCFVITITFVTILMNYLTARGETKFFTISLGSGFIFIIACVWHVHNSVPQMLYTMSVVLALVFLINLPSVLRTPIKEPT